MGPAGADTGAMALLVFMTLPGTAILLTVPAFVDRALLHAGRAGSLAG